MSEPRTEPIPVAEVTLLEDRALVVRKGRVRLPGGVTRLRVVDVAPVLADKTLSVSVAGAVAVTVADARVERRRRVLREDVPAEVRALDRELERLGREQARLVAEREHVVGALAEADEIARLTLRELAEDAGWGRVDEARTRVMLDAVRRREDGIAERALEVDQRLRDLQERMEDVQRRRAAVLAPSAELDTSVEVDLVAETEGEVELRIEYVTPGACWRPFHTAQLDEAAGKLRFRTDACVWQSTGERWEDVDLVLSTERPSLGAEPPALSTDRLHAHKRRAEVEVEAREERVHTAGLGAAEAELPELPGIDDAGEAVRLRAAERVTVPPDGRPHRFVVFEFESEVEIEHRLAAELVLAVVVRTEQVNRGRHPVLAGPVDLVRRSGLAGRSEVLYVAPGERFELGWGPDLALRVHREARDSKEKQRVLSSWITTPRRVTLKLSNIGPEPRTVRVVERVPVSEVEKVAIELEPDETTGHTRPDDDGFVRWTVELPAYGRRTVELGYTVRKHESVVGL